MNLNRRIRASSCYSPTQWQRVLTGEVTAASLAIVEFDGGRIRTRKTDCGPGVHLDGKGWNETKNAVFVSATSETSAVDPQPDPPACFLDADHVAKLTEKAKTAENTDFNERLPDESPIKQAKHKPQRVLRTVISSMKNSQEFGRPHSRRIAPPIRSDRRSGRATILTLPSTQT